MAVELTRPRARADARPLPGRVRLRRARRREAPLRGLRLGRADRLPPADLVDHPLAPLEDADPLPRPALPRAHLRRPRQRPLRPARRAATSEREFAADALAVMDATATERAVLVSLSLGAQRALLLAAEQPERVDGAVFICPAVPLGEPSRSARYYPWDEELDTDEGWAKYNRYYWLRDYRGFLEFFFSQMFNEPHSTKPIEDCVGWGLETDAETLIATELGREPRARTTARELAGRVRCPVLVIQGSEDAITGPGRGIALAEATGGELVVLEGSGHGPHARDPVKVNLLLRDFVAPPRAARALGARQVAPQARALRLVADRPRARAARRGDRRGAAQASPGPGDRLARPAPGHQGAGGARRAHPPRERAAGERVRPHRERVGRARPALLPGDPPDGRDPARQLHGLPRPRPRARTTTSGSATRRGSSTTTCTRTRSRRAPPTSG